MSKIYILAEKSGGEAYQPHELVANLEDFYANLEYGDVKEGEFQLWEHPTGKIFQIEADRDVEKKNYYATPYGANGTIWLPKLVEVSVDEDKVSKALSSLQA